MEVKAIPTLNIHNALSLALGGVATTPTQLVMLLLAIGGITIVMLSTFRRSRRSRKNRGESVRQRYEQVDRQRSATRDVEKAMIELDRLARQILGRIDTRFAKLETVIRDADERIATLSRLTNASTKHASVDVTLAPQPLESTAPITRAPEAEKRHDAVYQMADRGLSPLDIAHKTGKNKGEIDLILALRKTRQNGQKVESSAS